MKPQKKQEEKLAETLSSRVRQLREMRNMTVLDLARSCRFAVKRIEEIESGVEVWLSVTDRSILARVLGVQPPVLKEVEVCPSEMANLLGLNQKVDPDEVADRVLAGEVNIPCPSCGVILKTKVESALDFEGLPTQFARAYCPVCPFAVR